MTLFIHVDNVVLLIFHLLDFYLNSYLEILKRRKMNAIRCKQFAFNSKYQLSELARRILIITLYPEVWQLKEIDICRCGFFIFRAKNELSKSPVSFFN
jgi:hypothetical protein